MSSFFMSLKLSENNIRNHELYCSETRVKPYDFVCTLLRRRQRKANLEKRLEHPVGAVQQKQRHQGNPVRHLEIRYDNEHCIPAATRPGSASDGERSPRRGLELPSRSRPNANGSSGRTARRRQRCQARALTCWKRTSRQLRAAQLIMSARGVPQDLEMLCLFKGIRFVLRVACLNKLLARLIPLMGKSYRSGDMWHRTFDQATKRE